MKEKTSNHNSERYLTFSLGVENFAIPLLEVKEVIALPEVTPVPQTPNYFLGISNLRGQIITILDLRTKLGIKSTQTQETVVIVCDLSPYSIGIVVDSVNSVIPVAKEQIAPRPDLTSNKSDYITGIYQNQEQLILLLDVSRSLNLVDQSAVQKIQTQTEKKVA